MLGNGDGTFQPLVEYPTPGHPRALAPFVDMNHDGRPDVVDRDGNPDIAVANYNASTVTILRSACR
jgi:hypothetical protein